MWSLGQPASPSRREAHRPPARRRRQERPFYQVNKGVPIVTIVRSGEKRERRAGRRHRRATEGALPQQCHAAVGGTPAGAPGAARRRTRPRGRHRRRPCGRPRQVTRRVLHVRNRPLAVRDSPPALARGALDAAVPPRHGPHQRRGVQQDHPRALRRDPGHGALELPLPPHAGTPGRSPCGRKHRGGEAERLLPGKLRRPARHLRGCLPPRARERGRGRSRRERRPSRPALGLRLLHRQRGRGQARHGARSRQPHAGDARAGRQEPLHRGRHGKPARGGGSNRLWQVVERGPDLCGPGLPAGGPPRQRRAAGASRQRGRPPVRGAPTREPRLRQDGQPQAL